MTGLICVTIVEWQAWCHHGWMAGLVSQWLNGGLARWHCGWMVGLVSPWLNGGLGVTVVEWRAWCHLCWVAGMTSPCTQLTWAIRHSQAALEWFSRSECTRHPYRFNWSFNLSVHAQLTSSILTVAKWVTWNARNVTEHMQGHCKTCHSLDTVFVSKQRKMVQ